MPAIRLLLTAAGLLLLAGAPDGGMVATAETGSKAGKKEIQQLLDAQVAAWNKGNLNGFMKGYWDSPDLSFFSGPDRTKGWQATLERYQKRYQAEGKEMGKLAFEDLEIELLGSDSAWVRGQYKLITRKETFTGRFTLIVKKLSVGWRIVHDHTSS